MIKQNFASDILTYQMTCAAAPGPWLTSDNFLCISPRVWADTVSGISSIVTVKKATLTSDFVIWAGITTRTWYFPGYGFTWYEFDGTTGKMLRVFRYPEFQQTHNFQTNAIATALWAKMSRGGFVYMLIPFFALGASVEIFTVEPESELPFKNTGRTLSPNHFAGIWYRTFICVDEISNVALIVTGLTPEGSISVHNFATGALIRHIPVGGYVADAHWEEGNRAYVISSTGNIVLIDYTTGEIHSVTNNPLPAGNPFAPLNGSGAWKSAYYLPLKRMMFLAVSPDTVDGSSTMRILGYKNTPEATRITKPVPLTRQRVGMKTPVAVRVVGGIGEPTSSHTINASMSNPNAVLDNSSLSTDPAGYANFSFNGVLQGADILTVTANV